MLGGYESYWFTPLCSAGTDTMKKWQQAVVQLTDVGAQPRMESHLHAAGRTLQTGRALLPAQSRDRAVVLLGGRGEYWQGEVRSDGPAQPWKVNSLTVIAEVGNMVR